MQNSRIFRFCGTDAPCVAPSRVTQKIFAVLVEWCHHNEF